MRYGKDVFCVYILASAKYGTLYIGMTNDMARRIEEHREGRCGGFTQKYGINKLVYYETFQYVNDAIIREKQLKNWRRQWKINLIEQSNLEWEDLYFSMNG